MISRSAFWTWAAFAFVMGLNIGSATVLWLAPKPPVASNNCATQEVWRESDGSIGRVQVCTPPSKR